MSSCCCCPPAVSALFCLWLQSGCSKGTVAGALTFFPPEPALYQFERHTQDGRILSNDEEAKDESTSSNGDKSPSEFSKGTEPIEIPETREETVRRMKSPIEQLMEQAAMRRKRSKARNARDERDAAAGVTYKLLLNPQLQVPPHDGDRIDAVKVPGPRGIYIAVVIYRVPEERRNENTKTIILSHGNATDNGAMFPIQVVMAHALDCNVVSYDYSGYGESGGVPDEMATYRDIDVVFDYVVDQVADRCSKNVVLYGQSVGSGPCCYLASKPDEEIGGMILHSPFTSGMRVLTPSR